MTHKKMGRQYKVKRQERANERAEQVSPTALGQLLSLDKRLGVGVGATKERERLLAQLTEDERDHYGSDAAVEIGG